MFNDKILTKKIEEVLCWRYAVKPKKVITCDIPFTNKFQVRYEILAKGVSSDRASFALKVSRQNSRDYYLLVAFEKDDLKENKDDIVSANYDCFACDHYAPLVDFDKFVDISQKEGPVEAMSEYYKIQNYMGRIYNGKSLEEDREQ